uniref:DNA-directed RNA polymerase n=1 Tax=Tuber calosporum TaxID=1894963 RepID=A0A7S6VJ53_9PEZI|nr:DNA-directed RNA polymerase [Tuber calosporum]QOW39568.1 DNA-directed RNA polymerase [Tuber calosporum]
MRNLNHYNNLKLAIQSSEIRRDLNIRYFSLDNNPSGVNKNIDSISKEIIKIYQTHLDIFSKDFELFKATGVDYTCLDSFINNCKDEIRLLEGYKYVDRGLIDSVFLYIRVVLIYALFVDWVVKLTNIKWEYGDLNKSLVTDLACYALYELGFDKDKCAKLMDILKKWCNLEYSNPVWVVRYGVNKKDVVSLNYDDISKLKSSIAIKDKGNADLAEGLALVLPLWKAMFNANDKVYIKLCTDLLSIPETGWKYNIRRKLDVNYKIGYNIANLDEFVQSLFIKINANIDNIPFALHRGKKIEGGGFRYSINNNFFFVFRAKWRQIIIDNPLLKSHKELNLEFLDKSMKLKILQSVSNEENINIIDTLLENEVKFRDVIFLVDKAGAPNIEYIRRRSERLDLNSSYTKEVIRILNDERLPLFIREIKIEKFILDYEINYFVNSLQDGLPTTLLKIHKEARKAIMNRIELLCEDYTLENYDKLSKNYDNLNAQCVWIICAIGYEITANLTFINSLKSLSGDITVTQEKICIRLADKVLQYFYLEKEGILNRLQKDNILLFNLSSKFKDLNSWSDIDKINLGQILLDCILTTNIFDVEIEREGKKTFKNLSIKREFIEVLSNVALNINRLPMICKPVEWIKGSDNFGGYYNDKINYINNNSGVVHNSPRYRSAGKANSYQFDAVNYLSSVKFRINKELLDLILVEWDNPQSRIFNGENRLHESTYRLTNHEKVSKKLRTDILSHNQNYWNNRSILITAMMYTNLDLYIPCFLDFRGRIYSYVSYLNYQEVT